MLLRQYSFLGKLEGVRFRVLSLVHLSFKKEYLKVSLLVLG